MRATYSARLTVSSLPALAVLAKRNSGSSRSRLPGSCLGPPLIPRRNSRQNGPYFSGSSFASFASISSTRRVSAARIASTSRSCCSSSRDTFNGRSFESTMPLTKRRELPRVVHDEHAPHVQLEPAGGFSLPQVERRPRRNVEQAGVFALALDPVVAPGQRLGAVVRDVAVQVAVFLVLDLAARPGPQRLRLVDVLVVERGDALLLHAHRKGNVIGVAAHQRAQPHRVGEFLRVVLEVQHHAGAA